MSKLNDSKKLRARFLENTFVPENNLAISSSRTSTKKQTLGHSLGEQERAIEVYSVKESLKIIKHWEIAESASKHESRKYFQEMITYVKNSQSTKKPIKHIIFSHQSRAARNKHSLRELEDIVELGVTVHFARDNRKLTCASDMAELISYYLDGIRNEEYIVDLRKNVMGGMIRCIEEGRFPGRPPFGYLNSGDKGNKHFIFDEEKAAYMKEAFEKMATGCYSCEALLRELNLKYSYLDRLPMKNKFSELLKNPFYYGDFFYSGEIYKGNNNIHPQLIPKGLWLKVQGVLSGNKKVRRSQNHSYIGMMKCGGKILDDNGKITDEICGCSITGERIKKKYKNGTVTYFNYYRCGNTTKNCSQRNKSYMKENFDRRVSYRQAEIEDLFSSVFKRFTSEAAIYDLMSNFLRKEHFKSKSTHRKRIKLIRENLDQIRGLQT